MDKVHELLPEGIQRRVLLESSTYLGNAPFTEVELRDYAWRLAGNIPLLQSGKAAVPWVRQVEDEWMPLQVVGCQLKRNSREKIGAEYSFRVLAGTAVGALIKRFWSRNLCNYIARNIGFTPSWKKFPFRDIGELVGLRMYGLFTVELCTNSPKFETVQASGTLKKYNRDIIKKRRRVDFECPQKFPHPCHQCPVGYDACPLATHAISYERQECSYCHVEAWFDPKKSNDMCIECFNKLMLRQTDN